MPAAFLVLLLVADPATQLESKDVDERLAAVAAIAGKGHPQAQELLLRGVNDDDWEVVQRSVEALAVRGDDKAVKVLVDLAVNGPVRRIRFAAARTLKKLAPQEAAERVAKRLKRGTLLNAAEALAIIGGTGGAKAIDRMLKNKEVDYRVAAVNALGSGGKAEHMERWRKFLKDEAIVVRAAAIRALVTTGDRKAVDILRTSLMQPTMSQVMERRYLKGMRDLLAALPEKERDSSAVALARTFGMAGNGAANARFARLLGILGRKGQVVGPVAEYKKTLLSTGMNNSEMVVRRAAVKALERIADDAAWEKLHTAATSDSEWQVRFHALRACISLRGEKALPLVLDRIRYDDHKSVREEACVWGAKLKKPEAVKTLVAALKDKAWEVQVAAAVSVGKLHHPDGVQPLLDMAKSKDWRLRGAAAAGLGRVRHKAAVPVLIGLLRDKEAAVAASAREYLRHIAGKRIEAKPKAFRDWWAQREKNFTFRDPDAEARDAKKYGYATTRRGVYEDLDVVVLVTRKGGDNIQFLLKDYNIEHREIRAASVNKIGLHPWALFVANCPGEITNKDIPRLQWFVRTGGYLFASCWALTHTVHQCFPEVVDKLPLKGQVIGTVKAEVVEPDSRYIKGVVDPATSPLYELMGSHLIRVLDPERFEVLIDSPDAATRWGDGNLAGWFTIGHGTILDSANHFDLQGMKNAKLRTESDRMAFAMDHLGYEYKELRELRARGVFRKATDAEKETRDLSTFRFITTFVREKRLADEE
ncbi:MAG: HEAT repeat domain-containing protein [Planctomycetota bacterium]|jgi:HEAT repeat protein